MTDLATPGEIDAAADNRSTGYSLAKNGVGSWIVDGVDIADAYTSVDETVLNAFAYDSASSSGLDAVFDPGEAYVYGWLVRDTQSTVSLPDDATSTVYVGYDPDAALGSGEAPADSQNVIVGTASAFGSDDPRVPIYTVTTSGGTIDSVTDQRKLQQPVDYDNDSDITSVSSRFDVDLPYEAADGEVIASIDGFGRSFTFRRRGSDVTMANLSLEMEAGGNSFQIYSHSIDAVIAEFSTEGGFRARSGYSYLQNIELSGHRLLWDRDQTGEELLFQKDTTTAATVMALSDVGVGINGITNPVWALEVNGTITGDGLIQNRDAAGNPGQGIVLPDYANDSLPGGTEAGRMVYDSSRET